MPQTSRVIDCPRSSALTLVLTGLVMLLGAGAAPAADERPPNVLLIYTDDQGSLDLNCYGADDLVTPHLDALAERGVRFTQMYAPSAICSASRAGLLTGRIPARAGVPNNVSSRQGDAGLPPAEVTLAEMLRDAGYATGHVGKWHLGFTPETMPNGQGFGESFGHMGGCIDNYSQFFYWNGPNRHDLWRDGEEVFSDGRYFLDQMVEECILFIRHHREQPFFLYWAINAPHYPLQGTDVWREHYADLDAPRNMYAAFVSTIDERVGWLLKQLAWLGLQERTIVIFQSDHGHSTEERAFGGGGYAGPYRGAKGCLFEGGLRVPSIISWPGVIPAGEVRHQLATGCDWLPTIADLAGVELPGRQLDGRSLREVILSDAATPHEHFYWQLGSQKQPQWVVREGDWKLLGNPQDRSDKAPLTPEDRLFLVNLKDDVGEMSNLASHHPDVVERLQRLREAYRQSLQGTEQLGPDENSREAD